MRKTKIVATIGPACDSEEMIERMLEAGVDVFRFNMKHGDVEWHSERMERVERVCERLGQRVAILIDLQGPEVRIDSIPSKLSFVEAGQRFRFVAPGNEEGIALDHPEVFEHVVEGGTVYADDGFLEFKVIEKADDWFEVEVVEGGEVKPRKTVNFPGAHLSFPAMVEKDLEHLSLTARHHVDFVALSFVRTAEDLQILRRELKKFEVNCGIIAKIEHPDAVEHFDEILSESDGVMVAIGDLGIEYSFEEVPSLQKMIVRRCREEGLPVIVATQMLESMIENPRPTRAEVSDVANAVYDGADAVMLSAESAAGAYPVRSVKAMARIAERIESAEHDCPEVQIDWKSGGQTAAVVAAANRLVELGQEDVFDLKSFVVLTETGKTVNYLARLRPHLPIIAVTNDKKVLDQLMLTWGVNPVYVEYSKEGGVDVKTVASELVKRGLFSEDDKSVMIYGERWGTPGLTSVVRIQEMVE